MDTDDLAVLPASAVVLEAERDLIRRALHGLQDRASMGLVSHKHKKLALVLLEDGQDLRQLACLHRDKHDVIAFLRGQRFNGRHTVHSRFELGPVTDGEAFLVDPLFPLAPRQQSYRVFLVLCQPVGQLTALHACTVH